MDETLDSQLARAGKRVEALKQAVGPVGVQSESTQALWAELAASLEELHAAAAELREQRDEIAVTRDEVETERRNYQDLFDLAPDAYLVTDPAGVIRQANLAAGALFGVRVDWLEGKVLATFVAPESREDFRSRMAGCQDVQTTKEWSCALQPRDADPVPATVCVAPIRSGSGALTGLRWNLHDLSAVRQAEKRASRSGALLRTVVDAAPNLVFVMDAESRILMCNEALARFYGLFAADVVGRGQSDLHAACDGPSEDIEKWLADDKRVIETGAPLEMEMTGRDWEGTVRQFQTNKYPVELDDGSRGVLVISQDITERKQTEAIRACRSAVLQKIATGAPLGETLTTLLQHIEAIASGTLCSILMLDADGQHLWHGAAPSLPEEVRLAVDGIAIGPKAGSCGTAAFRREVVTIEDIETDPLCADYRELARAHGLRACWSTPILGEGDDLLGTFAIYYRQPVSPPEFHRRCVDLAMDLAAIAITRARTEARLHVSEGRLRRLVESNIIGMIITSTEGLITEANDYFLQMIGANREELAAGQLRWDTMTPPEWAAVDRQAVEKLLSGETCPPIEKEYFHRNGRRVPILITVATLEGAPGDCMCLISDLTERKQAEEAIQRYATIFRQAGWGMAIADPATQTLTQVNPAFAWMHGYTVEEMTGMNLADIFTPEARRDLPRHARIVEETGHYIYQAEHLRKDGSHFPCLTDVTAFKDETGRVVFRAATFEDITERERLTAALRAREADYRTLFESASDGILVCDGHGRNLEVNPAGCTMFGYTREEVWDLSVFDLLSADEAKRVMPEIARLSAGEVVCSEWQGRRREGTIFPVEASATVLPDGRILALLRDITERVKAEQKIRAQLTELLRWQEVTLGREGRVLELKHEVNELRKRLGEPVRYASAAEATRQLPPEADPPLPGRP